MARRVSTFLLGSISLIALCAPAFAQTGGDQIETVVVTAEKREQNIQSVPATVNALTGSQLSDIHALSLQDMAAYMPGLTIQPGDAAGRETVTIEGIAPTGSTTAARVYVDETPLGSSSGFVQGSIVTPDLMPYDVQRVEVLDGPQGTLYGANALSGVIKYVLAKPDATQFSGEVGADLFGIDNGGGLGEQVRGEMNVPLADDLAARGSFYETFTPGYIDDVVTGDKHDNAVHQIGGRFALLWEPTSKFSLQADVIEQHTLQNNTNQAEYDPTTLAPFSGGGKLSNNAYLPQPSDINLRLYSLTGKYDFGWANLVSATSYQRFRLDNTEDETLYLAPYGVPYTNFVVNPSTGKFTQEVRLASEGGGPVDWLVGFYFTHETTSQLELIDGYSVPYTGLSYNPLEIATLASTYTEYAGYADATWHITSALDLGGGVRYSYNDQIYNESIGGAFVGPLTSEPQGASHQGTTTWDINPSYHFLDNDMVYARIATGFQPGAPNAIPANVTGAPPFYNASTLTDYEVGVKTSFLDGRALADISAFYIDWSDIQVLVYYPACPCTLEGNGGTARSEGFNFHGNYSPIDGLVLGANLTYTDAVITAAIPTLFVPSGARLPYVPLWAWSLTADYTRPIDGPWNFIAGADYRHGGSSWSGVQGSYSQTLSGNVSTAFKDPAYNEVDLHFGVTDGSWKFSLYAKNLTNDLYLRNEQYQTNPFGVAYAFGGDISQPRTFGISIDKSF